MYCVIKLIFDAIALSPTLGYSLQLHLLAHVITRILYFTPRVFIKHNIIISTWRKYSIKKLKIDLGMPKKVWK